MDDSRLILVVGVEPEVRARIETALPRPAFTITCVDDTESALALTEGTAYDMVVARFPTPGRSTQELVKGLRWSGSACRTSTVVLVTEEEHLEAAEDLLDIGVARILNATGPEHVVVTALNEILSHDVRYPVKAFVRIPGPELGVQGTVMTQTDNLSRSGMLIRHTKPVVVGRRFTFSLALPNVTPPLTGTAEIVRVISARAGRGDGFAATFVTLDGDDGRRLTDFLARQPAPGAAH